MLVRTLHRAQSTGKAAQPTSYLVRRASYAVFYVGSGAGVRTSACDTSKSVRASACDSSKGVRASVVMAMAAAANPKTQRMMEQPVSYVVRPLLYSMLYVGELGSTVSWRAVAAAATAARRRAKAAHDRRVYFASAEVSQIRIAIDGPCRKVAVEAMITGAQRQTCTPSYRWMLRTLRRRLQCEEATDGAAM